MGSRPVAETSSPVSEYRTWLGTAVRNREKREHPESDPRYDHDEACLASGPTVNIGPVCWLPRGHEGIHSWQTPIDPSDCLSCGRDSCDGSCE